MSDEPDDGPEAIGARIEEQRDEVVNLLLEHDLGTLKLDPDSYRSRCEAVMAALHGLDGHDCLWVLGAVLGSTLADAPEGRRARMLVAMHLLAHYSTERALAVKIASATHHHEEGHA